MKRIVSCVILAALSVANAGAAAEPAAPGHSGQLPQVFSDLGVTMQSRVCGELMASLALGGVQALQSQFPSGTVPTAKRQPVYDTSAKSVVLLAMAGSLKLDERLKAGEVAQSIERMAPQVHVDTALFCQRRVEAWIRAGQVDKGLVTKASSQAQQLMDRAFTK